MIDTQEHAVLLVIVILMSTSIFVGFYVTPICLFEHIKAML